MSTIEERRARASTGVAQQGQGAWEDGFARPRVFLQPIAAPSVLGLFGFSGATMIVASNLAGWWGTPLSPETLAPFAGFFGGLAQFLAGMWAYKARDAVATAMHGMWGSFWLAYMTLWILVATGDITPGPVMIQALGWWFIMLAAITYSGALGALVEKSFGVFFVLFALAVGSTLTAIGMVSDISLTSTVTHAGGWMFVVSASAAWYVGTAMMVNAAAGKTLLPLFKGNVDANLPGRKATRTIELEWAEPGIKQGQ